MRQNLTSRDIYYFYQNVQLPHMKSIVRSAFHSPAIGSFCKPVVVKNLTLPMLTQVLSKHSIQRLGAGKHTRKIFGPCGGKPCEQVGQLHRGSHQTMGLGLFKPAGQRFAPLGIVLRKVCIFSVGLTSHVHLRRRGHHLHHGAAKGLP